MTRIGIFIFRRDLRVHDNTGLLHLARQVDRIVPLFILDPRQVLQHPGNQHYFSLPAVQFMCESLRDLEAQIGFLHLGFGEPATVLQALLRLFTPDTNVVVAFNADFSEYAAKRDGAIADVCRATGAPLLVTSEDFTLLPSELLLKGDGTAFRQFGAFYKNATKHAVPQPQDAAVRFQRHRLPPRAKVGREAVRFHASVQEAVRSHRLYTPVPAIAQSGGRTQALRRLTAATTEQRAYDQTRDRLSTPTSHLSAALNFGCISCREAYHALVEHKRQPGLAALAKQLYWRDFFLCVVRFVEGATSYSKHIDPRFDEIRWRTASQAKAEWQRLMSARTGFLLVDAAMTEMQQTGFMHNRARMLVGAFWTKYLRIHPYHPTYGSQVGFSRLLVDAVGPSQNKMNHAWVTELDLPGRQYAPKGVGRAGRPMDVSNRVLKKWDPEGAYVKRWLPHLARHPAKVLAAWEGDETHPGPMFDPKERYQEWIEACK